MMPPSREIGAMAALIGRLDGAPPSALRVDRRPLRGGLMAASVDRVAARYTDGDGRTRSRTMVVKRLAGATAREALVYERLVAAQPQLAPVLLAVDRAAPDEAVLYLEALRPVSAWPWRELRAARSVLELAARLHASRPDDDALAALRAWDFEAELRHMARLTIGALEATRQRPALWSFGGALRWTRRVVAVLPELRQRLRDGPLGVGVVHGDLHPGNVVLRRRDRRDEPVLLDWGRARLGSPLEDVSCWLQSLGTWEPEARRRHDTLFVAYLAARGLPPRLDGEMRTAYWLAGASNALSGALLHHLSVLLDDTQPGPTRTTAAHQAREWVRVLRRAEHVLRA